MYGPVHEHMLWAGSGSGNARAAKTLRFLDSAANEPAQACAELRSSGT